MLVMEASSLLRRRAYAALVLHLVLFCTAISSALNVGLSFLFIFFLQLQTLELLISRDGSGDDK